MITSLRFTAALIFLGAGFTGCISAGSAPIAGKFEEESYPERIWSIPTLYRNHENRVLQELAVIGQLQLQYAHGSDDYGTKDLPESATWGDCEVRRMRIGVKAKLLEKLSFLNLTDLYPDWSPRFYKRTPETFFTYSHNDAFHLSAGKTELKFNREQEYSSRELPTFERTALGNMFYGGELTGIWACGKGIAGGWLYELGAFNNERVDEFSHFGGGAMILGKIGYNYTARTSLDLAEVKFQYLHNTDPGYAASVSCTASPSYSDCVSLSNQIAEGPFGLTTEFLWGDGANGRPDVCGFMAMPTWSFSEKLQWVSTLEVAGSSEDNGVILPTRYEALAPDTGDKSGDAYFAAYTGLNYYLHGHKLKLMSGVKYSHLDGGSGGGDFSGWTWLAGLRMAF